MADAVRAGQHLGRYALEKQLGAGGGGEVWQAMFHGPAGFRRRVAVKLLPRRLRDPVHRDQLLQEARLGALVSHPNVVSTLELGTHEGRWFLVMDLVRGVGCDALLRARKPLPPAALLDVLVQVCQGLDHIHDLRDHDDRPLGLVHRDIKPANVLITPRGLVKIVDLGVARLAGAPDEPAGTPGYMAPEQLEGGEDRRADLFGVGTLGCRLALRLRPFGKGMASVQRLSLYGADALVAETKVESRLDAFLPGLGPVLVWAMRHQPAERPPDAHALERELRALFPAASGDRLGGWLQAGDATFGQDTRTPSPAPEHRSFVGRVREREALLLALTVPGLVTVTGPAGVGKSRLIEEVLGTDPRAVLCDATACATPESLWALTADRLEIEGFVDGPTIERIGTALAERERPLLAFDAVEHLTDEVASAVSRWLAMAPDLRVVCGSRVVVPATEGTVLRLRPLPADDAMALVRQRLGRPADAEALRRLVEAGDRLPLVLELAAARARAVGLDDAVDDVTRAGLEEALQRSWDGLDASQQRSLVQLASFVRPFGLRDAAAVLDVTTRPMDVLHQLVDHSLVDVRRSRFRVLPSVRAFIRARDAGARDEADARHAAWWARLGGADFIASLPDQPERWQLLHDHMDEVVTGWRRSERLGRTEWLAPLAVAAGHVFQRRGPVAQGAAVVERSLQTGRREAALCRLMARFARLTSAPRAALDWAERGARAIDGDQDAVLRCARFAEYMRTGLDPLDRAAARAHGEAAQALLEAGSAYAIQALGDHGAVLTDQGRDAEALGVLRDTLAEAARSGRGAIDYVRMQYGLTLVKTGSYTDGLRVLDASLPWLDGRGNAIRATAVRMNMAGAYGNLGRMDEARAMLEGTGALARPATNRIEGWVHLMAAQMAVFEEDAEQVLRWVGPLRAIAGTHGTLAVIGRNLEGQAHCQLGATERGLAMLRESWTRRTELSAGQLGNLVQQSVRHLPGEEGRAWLAATAEEAAVDVGRRAITWNLARAEVAIRTGELDGAHADLRQARERLRNVECPPGAPMEATLTRLEADLATARAAAHASPEGI